MQDFISHLRSILVPVDGSEASLEALSLACMVAKRNKGKVYVIYTIAVSRALPLDAQLLPEAQKGEELLSRAEEVAQALDFAVEGELLQARDVGHAIVDEAIERSVDGIFMGIEYSSPFGLFQVTPAAEYVLGHAPCHVWLCRSSVRGGEGR